MFRNYPINNRIDAGTQIAMHEKIIKYKNSDDTIILALPRGGVPVAYQIGKKLRIPFDMIFVRKLGLPAHEETAMGAIGMDNVVVYNDSCINSYSISKPVIESIMNKEKVELERRNKIYRGDRPFPNLKNKNVIIVDDGIASGATMKAAIKIVKLHFPSRIIVAVPVGPPEVIEEIQDLVDEVICIHQPSPFHAVGLWYGQFPQVNDEEVQNYIRLSNEYNNGKN